jgi:Xaa-Pro aminopeptidase
MIEDRIQKARQLIASKGFDALMVSIEENRYYLSGFTGEDHQFDESAGVLFISNDKLALATDTRFEIQATQEAPLYEILIYKKGLAKELPGIVRNLDITKLGFESIRVSISQQQAYQKELEKAGAQLELIPVEGLVERLRLIKSAPEVAQTRMALSLAEDAFRHVVTRINPGMTEKGIAWEMESYMRMAGAENLSFPVIVAAGPNSALPHAIPTDRPIQKGEPILFDWGAQLNHYCSDTSRTVILGTPDEHFLTIFHTVLDAQQMAIKAIKSGANSKSVDAIARDHISAAGFGDKFGHGLGHGTGLAVHEGPRLSPLKDTTLETGMLVTVEPGIYLPDWGGVRIENQILVGPNGADVLNRLSTTYDIDQL